MTEPISTKPYLLRALYEWCVDNGYTPYVSVVVNEQTQVPMEYVRDGEIVLNIGPLAANRLKMGNEYLEFAARFSGVAQELMIPVSQVAAIYARESGQGMSFPVESESVEPATETAPSITPVPDPVDGAEPAATSQDDGSDERPVPPAGGKPTLRVVK